MNRHHSLVLVLCLTLLVLPALPGSGFAYEIETHEKISEAAAK